MQLGTCEQILAPLSIVSFSDIRLVFQTTACLKNERMYTRFDEGEFEGEFFGFFASAYIYRAIKKREQGRCKVTV